MRCRPCQPQAYPWRQKRWLALRCVNMRRSGLMALWRSCVSHAVACHDPWPD